MLCSLRHVGKTGICNALLSTQWQWCPNLSSPAKNTGGAAALELGQWLQPTQSSWSRASPAWWRPQEGPKTAPAVLPTLRQFSGLRVVQLQHSANSVLRCSHAQREGTGLRQVPGWDGRRGPCLEVWAPGEGKVKVWLSPCNRTQWGLRENQETQHWKQEYLSPCITSRAGSDRHCWFWITKEKHEVSCGRHHHKLPRQLQWWWAGTNYLSWHGKGF
jgi:hypothetical protein